MVFLGRSAEVIAATLLAAGSVRATAQESAIKLLVYGGGYTAQKDVSTISSARFRTGFTIGGGIGYEIDNHVEVRATLTGAQSQLLQDGAPSGVYLNRYFVAADVKGAYPLAGGITPYGLLGAGAVLLHEKGASRADKTQGFAHLGVGIAYPIGKTGLAVFAQSNLFAYSLSGMTSPTFVRFSATQIDLGWSAGASYRLPL